MNITKSKNTITITSSPVYATHTYIHVVQQITTTSEIIIHEAFTESISSKTLPSDGYYKVTEFWLPNTAGEGYYIIDSKVYTPTNEQISVEQLLDVNIAGTNIARVDQDLFNEYNLNDYYISLIKSKFLKNICNCDCLSAQDRRMIDTLTMGLSLIEVLNTYLQFYESQRIVEQLYKCQGVVNTNCNCNG